MHRTHVRKITPATERSLALPAVAADTLDAPGGSMAFRPGGSPHRGLCNRSLRKRRSSRSGCPVTRISALWNRDPRTRREASGQFGRDCTELELLQREIVGPNALHYGVRRSPVFIGESDRFGQEMVRYIAPHWDDAQPMLCGLRAVLGRTTGLSSVARAGVISFGFVYLHPMFDGNGRISRFWSGLLGVRAP